MGWCADSPEHEGYLVGIVPEGYHWRELRGDDPDVADLKMVQVGCECGWRSARIAAPYNTSFHPSIVCAPPEFEELCRRIWKEHLQGSIPGTIRPSRMPWSDSGQCYMPFEMLREIREEAEGHVNGPSQAQDRARRHDRSRALDARRRRARALCPRCGALDARIQGGATRQSAPHQGRQAPDDEPLRQPRLRYAGVRG